MSRLTDALRVLLGKCTPAGTQPVGDKVDDFVECLAGHYNGAIGSRYLINITGSKGAYVADKTYAEIKTAIASGKIVNCVSNNKYYYLDVITADRVRFTATAQKLSDDGNSITASQLYVLQITNANTVTIAEITLA